jgi:HEAT repeat protein
MLGRAFGAATLALLTAACSRPGADEQRVKELEARVERLEERLADTPAAAVDLATADLDELATRLDSADAIVRYRAGHALAGRIGESLPLLLDLLRNGTRRQKQAAAQVLAQAAPPEAAGDLVEAHGRTLDSKARAWLDTALARTGQSDAFDPLVADLAHSSQTVRIAAVQGLSQLKDARAAMPLVNAAIQGDPVVAQLARQALRELDETAALFVETQWDVLGPRERQSVVEAMGPIAGKGVETFLEARLADASPRVALEAALQLARRGSMAGRHVAFERLSSDDASLARIARDVLDAIEAHHGSQDLPTSTDP